MSGRPGGFYTRSSTLTASRRSMARNVRVEGRLTFNSLERILAASLAGFGLAYLPEDMARPHIAADRLRQVLDDWCPLFPGYHLYYPERRQPSPAFALLVDALRYRPHPPWVPVVQETGPVENIPAHPCPGQSRRPESASGRSAIKARACLPAVSARSPGNA